MRHWLPISIALLGCASSAAPPAAPPSQAPGVAKKAEPPPRPAPEPQPEVLVAEPPPGCAGEAELGEEAGSALSSLAAACISEMKPLLPEPLVFSLSEDARKDLPFTVLEEEKCVRVLAAGSAKVSELDLRLVDRADRELSADRIAGRLALLSAEGPVCLTAPGQYRAVVRVAAGQGDVAVQIFQAE